MVYDSNGNANATTLTMSADALLIRRFLSGDTEANAEVDRWIACAASAFRRRLADAWEDVLQELRLEVFRLLESQQFRGDSSLKTYLWQVVNRSCIDQIRARSKWRWEELGEAEGEGEALLPRPSGAGRHEVRDLLQRVLAKTPEDCRKLWRMIVDGMSYREMSQRVEIAEGTLRVRVLRCRQRATKIRGEILTGAPSVHEEHP